MNCSRAAREIHVYYIVVEGLLVPLAPNRCAITHCPQRSRSGTRPDPCECTLGPACMPSHTASASERGRNRPSPSPQCSSVYSHATPQLVPSTYHFYAHLPIAPGHPPRNSLARACRHAIVHRGRLKHRWTVQHTVALSGRQH